MKYSFCSNSYRYVGTNLLSKTSISEEKSILPSKSGRLTILQIPHMIMKFCKLAKRPKSKVIPSDLAILKQRKTLNCKINISHDNKFLHDIQHTLNVCQLFVQDCSLKIIISQAEKGGNHLLLYPRKAIGKKVNGFGSINSGATKTKHAAFSVRGVEQNKLFRCSFLLHFGCHNTWYYIENLLGDGVAFFLVKKPASLLHGTFFAPKQNHVKKMVVVAADGKAYFLKLILYRKPLKSPVFEQLLGISFHAIHQFGNQIMQAIWSTFF